MFCYLVYCISCTETCTQGLICWYGSHSCRYLISHGANVAAVNSEGEVPSDIAEEAAMKDLLLEQVKKQGRSVVGLNM